MSRPQRLNTFCHATASALCHDLPVWVEVGRTTRPAPKMPTHSYCISLVMPLVDGSIAWPTRNHRTETNQERPQRSKAFHGLAAVSGTGLGADLVYFATSHPFEELEKQPFCFPSWQCLAMAAATLVAKVRRATSL